MTTFSILSFRLQLQSLRDTVPATNEMLLGDIETVLSVFVLVRRVRQFRSKVDDRIKIRRLGRPRVGYIVVSKPLLYLSCSVR